MSKLNDSDATQSLLVKEYDESLNCRNCIHSKYKSIYTFQKYCEILEGETQQKWCDGLYYLVVYMIANNINIKRNYAPVCSLYEPVNITIKDWINVYNYLIKDSK